MKMCTSGEIYRAFLSQDKYTVLRRLNLRYFVKKYNVNHIVCQSKWLIDFDDFMEKINLNKIQNSCQMPRLRTKITAQNEWNASHRKHIKHFIIDQICASGKVSVRKHGRYNIINYDELEVEIKNVLKGKEEIERLRKEKQLQQIELKKHNKEQKELAKLEKLKLKKPVGRPKEHKLNG